MWWADMADFHGSDAPIRVTMLCRCMACGHAFPYPDMWPVPGEAGGYRYLCRECRGKK